MNGIQLMNTLFEWSPLTGTNTRDGLVFGDKEKEIRKLAVCCIATVDVIKKAAEWGADAILTHEPTFHDHFENHKETEVYKRKLALIEENGLSIFRFHDGAHFTPSDRIVEGVLKETGWEGSFDGNRKFTFDSPVPSAEIYRTLCERLNLSNIRFIGNGNEKIRTLSMCVGAWGPDYVFNETEKSDIDGIIVGENCEWSLGEYCRDAIQLGIGKPLFILGHMGSEKDGMKYIAGFLKDALAETEVEYFDCGELFTKL